MPPFKGNAEEGSDFVKGTYQCLFQLKNNKTIKMLLKDFCISKQLADSADIFMNDFVPENNESFMLDVG